MPPGPILFVRYPCPDSHAALGAPSDDPSPAASSTAHGATHTGSGGSSALCDDGCPSDARRAGHARRIKSENPGFVCRGRFYCQRVAGGEGVGMGTKEGVLGAEKGGVRRPPAPRIFMTSLPQMPCHASIAIVVQRRCCTTCPRSLFTFPRCSAVYHERASTLQQTSVPAPNVAVTHAFPMP